MSTSLEVKNLVLEDFHECLSYPDTFKSGQHIRTVCMKGDAMEWQWQWNSLLSVTLNEINLPSLQGGYSTDLCNT